MFFNLSRLGRTRHYMTFLPESTTKILQNLSRTELSIIYTIIEIIEIDDIEETVKFSAYLAFQWNEPSMVFRNGTEGDAG